MMDETDKEFRRIFEATTTRNVRAAIAFGNETRALIHALEKKVGTLEERISIQDQHLELLRRQLAPLQAKVFSGGT